jgi:hypothetical protein
VKNATERKTPQSVKTKLFPITIVLSFVSASLRADVAAGNIWHNPTFELGDNLDQPTGTPMNWNRGGADGSILQPSTANSVSATRSLAVGTTFYRLRK